MRYEIFSDNSISPLKINTLGFSGDIEVTKFGPAKKFIYHTLRNQRKRVF